MTSKPKGLAFHKGKMHFHDIQKVSSKLAEEEKEDIKKTLTISKGEGRNVLGIDKPVNMSNSSESKEKAQEEFDKKHYKWINREWASIPNTKNPAYLKFEKFERACLDPEGRPITYQTGDIPNGEPIEVNSEEYLWRYDTDNYNNYDNEFDVNNKDIQKTLHKMSLKEIPKPLPLPEEWRKLLPEHLTIDYFFSDKSFDNERVHTHFSALYEAINRGGFPLFGGDENGGVYIEPSKTKDRVYFCGRGDLACYYYLDL